MKTKKLSWKNLNAGSIIAIPSDERFIIGQVLIPGESFYFCVYSLIITNVECIQALPNLDARIILIGETTDAELYRGVWQLCGCAPISKDIPLPYHVVNTKDGLFLRDFDRNIVRSATEVDKEIYGYEVSVSPTKFTREAQEFVKYGLISEQSTISVLKVTQRSQL